MAEEDEAFHNASSYPRAPSLAMETQSATLVFTNPRGPALASSLRDARTPERPAYGLMISSVSRFSAGCGEFRVRACVTTSTTPVRLAVTGTT